MPAKRPRERVPRRRTCASAEADNNLLKISPEYRKVKQEIESFTRNYYERYFSAGLRSGLVIIPVVVHVVYNTAEQNVSDAQIQSQINVLNQDYRRLNADASTVPPAFQPVAADCRIQFQLAARDPNCNPTTGITRTSTTVTSFTFDGSNPTAAASNPVKFASSGGHDAWPRDKYLNLWVCKLSSGLLGYSTFPGWPANVDGVVITYTAFGNMGTAAAPFNLGRTATHEIGHWLNLRHIWGDAVCGDDFVADTPVQHNENYDCPPFPHISAAPCANGPNGDMFMNYMDYVNDNCMVMFTAGQSNRMDATLYGPRSSIVASDALIPPVASIPVDLWSADKPEDTGAEPDAVPAPMYETDDIWVRRQNDGITNQEHQNPEYRASGSPNYVYVRVRNRGCSLSGTGTVRLYWAKASTALGWPAPWDGSVTSPALMGGLISSQPTGTVAAAGFTILEFAWSPPNPADYSSFGADQSHFCLLSRIETSSTPPYGMTFPEGPDLGLNVRNNNNIVWKNISVVPEGTSGGRLGAVTIGNLLDDGALIRLSFSAPRERLQAEPLKGIPSTVFDWGAVEVDLGEKLYAIWKDCGAIGEGIKETEGTRLLIPGPEAWIGNIRLKPRQLETLKIHFTPYRKGANGFHVFFLDVQQLTYNERGRKRVGGQRFVIKTLGPRTIAIKPLRGKQAAAKRVTRKRVAVLSRTRNKR